MLYKLSLKLRDSRVLYKLSLKSRDSPCALHVVSEVGGFSVCSTCCHLS